MKSSDARVSFYDIGVSGRSRRLLLSVQIKKFKWHCMGNWVTRAKKKVGDRFFYFFFIFIH